MDPGRPPAAAPEVGAGPGADQPGTPLRSVFAVKLPEEIRRDDNWHVAERAQTKADVAATFPAGWPLCPACRSPLAIRPGPGDPKFTCGCGPSPAPKHEWLPPPDESEKQPPTPEERKQEAELASRWELVARNFIFRPPEDMDAIRVRRPEATRGRRWESGLVRSARWRQGDWDYRLEGCADHNLALAEELMQVEEGRRRRSDLRWRVIALALRCPGLTDYQMARTLGVRKADLEGALQDDRVKAARQGVGPDASPRTESDAAITAALVLHPEWVSLPHEELARLVGYSASTLERSGALRRARKEMARQALERVQGRRGWKKGGDLDCWDTDDEVTDAYFRRETGKGRQAVDPVPPRKPKKCPGYCPRCRKVPDRAPDTRARYPGGTWQYFDRLRPTWIDVPGPDGTRQVVCVQRPYKEKCYVYGPSQRLPRVAVQFPPCGRRPPRCPCGSRLVPTRDIGIGYYWTEETGEVCGESPEGWQPGPRSPQDTPDYLRFWAEFSGRGKNISST